MAGILWLLLIGAVLACALLTAALCKAAASAQQDAEADYRHFRQEGQL